jgi:phosphonate transport system substrate-binding protein
MIHLNRSVLGAVSIFAMLLAAPLFGASSTKAADTFVFTAIPDEDQAKLRKRFDKIAVYLTKKLGVTTKYIPVKSYGAAVTAFRNDQVQLAWFGGLSGVRARTLVKGSQAIAQGAEDVAFFSFFIAHSSTGLKKSKEFPKGAAGKTFTFGSKGSTSGRLIPEFHIREAFGKGPAEVFSKVGFSGNHTKTLQLVQSGAYQVGSINQKVWKKELKAGNIDTNKVSIIWRTPPYPNYQWSIRGDVEKKFGNGFIKKVTTTLLNLKDKDLLASFPRSSFVPAKNSDYQPILDVGRKIKLID